MHVVVEPRRYLRQRKINLLLQQIEIGVLHVWETETEEERKEAEIEIARINAEMAEKADLLTSPPAA